MTKVVVHQHHLNMNFEAQLTLDGKVSLGLITFKNRSLIFSSKDGILQKTFDEYSTLATYSENKKIIVTSTIDPKIKLIVFEPKFASALSKEMDIQVKSGLMHFFRRNENLTYVVIFFGILLFGVLFSLLTKLGSGYITQFISFELEQSIGKKAFNSSFNSRVVKLNSDAENLWQTLIHKIMTSKHDIKHEVQFYIIKDDIPNAFALPGGIIAVNTGLIKKAESAEEVLGVLAHELGHVKHRDSLNSMVHIYGSKLVLGILFGGSNLTGYTSGLADLKNSRNQESRADKYAIEVLNSANISSHGFASFFEKLDSENKIGLNLSWLSTHPSSKNRIFIIKTVGKSDYDKFDFPWDRFQNLIGQIDEAKN